jgi:hypothetical protein
MGLSSPARLRISVRSSRQGFRGRGLIRTVIGRFRIRNWFRFVGSFWVEPDVVSALLAGTDALGKFCSDAYMLSPWRALPVPVAINSHSTVSAPPLSLARILKCRSADSGWIHSLFWELVHVRIPCHPPGRFPLLANHHQRLPNATEFGPCCWVPARIGSFLVCPAIQGARSSW